MNLVGVDIVAAGVLSSGSKKDDHSVVATLLPHFECVPPLSKISRSRQRRLYQQDTGSFLVLLVSIADYANVECRILQIR